MSSQKKHATFSASGAHRWMNCPGSIALSQKAPEAPESKYAKEGTEAHEVLEIFLKSKRPHSEAFLLKQKYPEEMITHAFEAYKTIEKMVPRGGKLLSESRVNLSFIHPDTFGTLDAAIVEEFGVLHVIDYKYGAGIPVYPDDNPQLIYYALGIANEYDFNFTHINLVIIQPRASTPDKKIVREWKMTVEDLYDWQEKFKNGIHAALAKNPGLAAGDWCTFCPATVLCPEISSRALAQAQIDFDPANELSIVEAPDPSSLSVEQLGRSLEAAERIEVWISGLRSYAFECLKRGEQVPGFKLVPKRATRKWEDPAEVEKLAKKKFGTKIYEQKMLSPAQFEKRIDKSFVDQHCVSISSGVTLAHEDDRRSGVNQIEDDFSDLS